MLPNERKQKQPLTGVFYRKPFWKISKNSLEYICNGAFLVTQPAFTFSKLTIETLEQDVKYVQS